MGNRAKIIVFVLVSMFSILSSAANDRWTTENDKTGRYVAVRRYSVSMAGPTISTYCNPGDLLIAGGCDAPEYNAVLTRSAPLGTNGWECAFTRYEKTQFENGVQNYKLVSTHSAETQVEVKIICQSQAKK